MEERHKGHCAFHSAMSVAGLLIKAAGVAAAVCLVKEVHRVHKAIELHRHNR